MNQTLLILAFALILFLCLLLDLAWLGIVFSLCFAWLMPALRQGAVAVSLVYLLAFFLPLFPEVGVVISGRILNWYDLILLGFAASLALRPLSQDFRERIDRVGKGIIVFLGVLFLLVFRSPDPLISFRDWISYAVNFLLVWLVVFPLNRRQMRTFLGLVAMAVLIVTLIGLWQKLMGFQFASTADGEVSIRLGVPSTLGDSLILSMFGAMMFVLGLFGYLRSETDMQRGLQILALTCSLICIRLSLSRNGILMIVVVLLVLLLLQFTRWILSRRNAIKIPMVLVFLPIFGGFSLFLLPTDIYHRITSVFYLFSSSPDPVIAYNIRSTLGRLENYREALRQFMTNPVEGMGLGMYPHLTKFHDADGFYPGLAAETGMAGILAFLVFWWAVVLELFKWRKLRTGRERLEVELMIALFAAMTVVSFFEPVLKLQVMSFYFFFMLRQVICNPSP